jgi:hypothetical protein
MYNRSHFYTREILKVGRIFMKTIHRIVITVCIIAGVILIGCSRDMEYKQASASENVRLTSGEHQQK